MQWSVSAGHHGEQAAGRVARRFRSIRMSQDMEPLTLAENDANRVGGSLNANLLIAWHPRRSVRLCENALASTQPTAALREQLHALIG
jgi:hypothetical protein